MLTSHTRTCIPRHALQPRTDKETRRGQECNNCDRPSEETPRANHCRVTRIDRPCIFPVIILLAVLLSAKRFDRTVGEIGAFLALFPIWAGTLTVGCLVMIPMWIWRLCIRLTRKTRAETAHQKQLWDQWMDGPYPL